MLLDFSYFFRIKTEMTGGIIEAGVEKVVTTHIGKFYKGKKKKDEKLRARIQKLCGVELKRIERLP